jgi:hypothetical protein
MGQNPSGAGVGKQPLLDKDEAGPKAIGKMPD